MIGISRLLCGTISETDRLRYPEAASSEGHGKRPVVVWNITRRCNLHCAHCYIDAQDKAYKGEFSHEEALAVIDDLVKYQIPVLLFSGGEPLMRHDLFSLCEYATSKGIRTVLSTNGTLITPENAKALKKAGMSYIGVSLDGTEKTHDKFRGKAGAYQETLQGIRNSLAAGLRTGLRFTITSFNMNDVDAVFDLLEAEGIQRACFYHLAYGGRGGRIVKYDLTPQQSRGVIDRVFARTRDLYARGVQKDILTVDNHADAVYLYMQVLKEDPARAAEIAKLLEWNGGNSSGKGIGDIDYLGNVHPDQFWQHYTVGNIRQKPFSQIWSEGDELLNSLRNRGPLLKGRCAACQFKGFCNGNLRIRAEAVYNDLWAPDPACYLTDEEIGIKTPARAK